MVFYQVFRIFIKKDGTHTHSIEYKDDYKAALQRYFNIIAADLANVDIVYNAAYLIDYRGSMHRHEVFDNRPPEPESTDEQ